MVQASKNLHVLIAGGGPAGSSLAIRLQRQGHQVTLLEKEKFPRHKLCGEFISPECLTHFDELGVRNEMLTSGGASIAETVFYEINGRGVAVPSDWFGHAGRALSLSRARMDHVLLDKARAEGVEVIAESTITAAAIDDGRITNLKIRSASGETGEIAADLVVDATGRARALSKVAARETKIGKTNSRQAEKLVGFKVHLEKAAVPAERCEIYSFPGGYAGLSPIEDGLANLCMMVRPWAAKKHDQDRLISDLVRQNKRARETLRDAEPVSGWLAVAVDRFGAKELRPAKNLFAVGDSAAFIDPFTGSGMLMALEGSRLLAAAFAAVETADADAIAAAYAAAAAQLFSRRLRVSSIFRRAAFSPAAATATVRLLGASVAFRRLIARSTRGRGAILSEAGPHHMRKPDR